MTLETNRPRNFRKHLTMILLQKEINQLARFNFEWKVIINKGVKRSISSNRPHIDFQKM